MSVHSPHSPGETTPSIVAAPNWEWIRVSVAAVLGQARLTTRSADRMVNDMVVCLDIFCSLLFPVVNP